MTLAGGTHPLTAREIDRLMSHYEGLVCRTAQLLVSGEHPECKGRPVETEEDDVRQVLRMKVHYALKRYDPGKVVKKYASGTQRYGSSTAADKARDGYINMAVRDASKDVVKRKRRGELHIEDIAPAANSRDTTVLRDKFDERYLSVAHDEAFTEVEDEFPELPNTLTALERQVTGLMFDGFRQTEISVKLAITKRETESAVRGIRAKLADWRPSGAGRPARAVVPA